jgi:Zn-dependent M16 (insulinase) family peptidase
MEEPTTVSLSTDADELAIILELISESKESSPALIHETGRSLVASLQREGYELRPVYTGTRGGLFVVEVIKTVTPALTQVATYIQANHATIEEVLSNTSSLVTIIGGAIAVIKHVFSTHQSQVGPTEAREHPLKVSITIDGASIEVEGQDVTQVDAVLALAHKYATAHPQVAQQVSTKSKTKVQARVSGKPRRRRK